MDILTQSKKPYFFCIDFEMNLPVIHPLDELPDDILIDLPNYTNVKKKRSNTHITIDPSLPTKENYGEAFDHCLTQINLGNSYLLNLTFASELRGFNSSLDDIFHSAVAEYKLKYKNKFVVFSPESFITIENNVISTYPMKGTISATDILNGKRLLDDAKEAAEHATIVDLLRNDLSQVARKVTVQDYRYLQIVGKPGAKLFQTSSKITGNLREEYQNAYGSLLFKLLPAGSISGAPKAKTVEIIQAAELSERGYYTGVFGVFDGKKLKSAVMIRYIEQHDGKYYYRSGGGITHLSKPMEEYEELKAKIYIPTT